MRTPQSITIDLQSDFSTTRPSTGRQVPSTTVMLSRRGRQAYLTQMTVHPLYMLRRWIPRVCNCLEMDRLGDREILEYVRPFLCQVYCCHSAPTPLEVQQDTLRKPGVDDTPSKFVSSQSASCREIVVAPAPPMLDDSVAHHPLQIGSAHV